jgi:signal transduction histidine kinase
MIDGTKQPPVDVAFRDGWKGRPFPEIAAALRASLPRIMARWESAMRESLPAAGDPALAQLRDQLPGIVDEIADEIADALAEAPTAPAARRDENSKPPADDRFQPAYGVDDLMIAYHLLRRILPAEVAGQLGRELAADELAAIGIRVDAAQRRGVVAFVDHLGGQLRAADELQSSYISYLNHDLRGGMNGILLMVEVLKRELRAEPRFTESADDLEAMRRSILESVATMDRFVFAHRLGRRKQKARFVAIDLNALAKDVVSTLDHTARERAVIIGMDVAPGCSLESDRDLVRLILYNALSNTIKHARREGGTVTLSALSREGGGCRIAVTDDGPGIPPEQLGTLFTPSTTTTGTRHLKLGLPVSKMAADLIGATLAIDSRPGAGTTVRLELPNRGIH